MIRKTVLLLTVMAAAILLSAGVALAARVLCDGGVCKGTNRGDLMTGTNRVDKMYGLGGNDRMGGGRGNDYMLGGPGADSMGGGYGNDVMYGGDGGDTLSGGFANDRIFGGPGSDTVYGGSGNDYINVVDGQPDSIRCGTGTDTAVVDTLADIDQATLEDFIAVTSCENVVRR